jgi:integrase
MKKPYRLKRRGPKQIWYYMLSTDTSFHSTGETVRTKAENFVLAHLNDNSTPLIKPKAKQPEITLMDFCSDFFVWETCAWIRRTHERGLSFEKQIAQMRRGHLENHIFPALGSRSVKSLRVSDMDAFFDSLSLSNQTKNHILSTLSIVFKEAQRKGVIRHSPLDCFEPFVNNPKTRDILTQIEEHRIFPANVEEAVKIWGSLQYATFFSLLHTTGARLGEIGALTWDDFSNAKYGTICINKALKNDKTVGTTKTGKMVFVPYLEPCVSLVGELKKQHNPEHDAAFIFLNSKGAPIDRGVLMAAFKRVLKQNGITQDGRNLVIHSLRHGFNTKVKESLGGEVARLMTGHTSEKMTARYYHPDLEKERMKVSAFIPELSVILSGA